MKTKQKNMSGKKPLWISVVTVIIAVSVYLINEWVTVPEMTAEGEMAVHFIDVGQGDSELICTSDAVILIDAGTTESQYILSDYLKANITQIDYMILTHPHEDHIGGAAHVINSIPVTNVIMPDVTANTSCFSRLLNAMEDNNIGGIIAEAGKEY